MDSVWYVHPSTKDQRNMLNDKRHQGGKPMVDQRGTRARGKEKAAKKEDTGGTDVKTDAMQILTFADVVV